MPDPTDRDRIADLEAAGRVQDDRIGKLETAGLVFDEQVLALAREVDGLQRMIEHRAAIEQAKGVIMQTLPCGPDAAFAVLVAQSQHENRKLHDVAEEIVRAAE